MLADSHVHTGFSTDSGLTFKQAVHQANRQKIGITITEHMDLDYPEPGQFFFDAEEYFGKYGPLRTETILLGIEVGMQTNVVQDNRTITDRYPFDYVLGSIHLVDRVDIYGPGFYEGRSKRETYQRYFDTMIACLRTYDFIDSLGHIDYIARYGRYDDPEIHYSEFADPIDRVLALVADQGKAMEINTRRLDNPDVGKALLPLYKRFYELGGRLVTIGSDAHHPQDVGKGLNTALALAEECQLRAVRFVRRKPQFL